MKKQKLIIFKILKVIKMFFIVLLVMLLIFVLNGAIEYKNVTNQIDDFVSRGELVYETSTYQYYQVKPIYEYEDTSRHTFSPGDLYVGSIGDVIVTSRNPMRDVPLLSLPIGLFSKYFYVGHSTINATLDGRVVVESEGKRDMAVIEGVNTWIRSSTCPTTVGVRVKTSVEVMEKAVDYCYEQIGKPYNPTFLFNRANSYYCTDLISRAYRAAGININYDYLATTGNDMIVSSNTYMFFYMEQFQNEDKTTYKVYFLSNEEF